MAQKIDSRIERVLFSHAQIQAQIKKAAKWIDKNYQGKNPIVIAILKGAIPFYGALITQITCDIQLDFMVFSSFKGSIKATSAPKLVTDLSNDITDRHVIIVEDIVDSGRTINAIKELFKIRNPKSIAVVSLIDKPSARKELCEVDFSCFKTGPNFLVGFGLDYKEYMRNLPYVGILKKEIYMKELRKIKNKK